MKKLKKLLWFILVTVVLSVTTIASISTSEIDNMTFDTSSGQAKLVTYSGKSTEINIPEKYNGFDVTTISYDAFNNQDIQVISLPITIETIEQNTFENCGENLIVTLEIENPQADVPKDVEQWGLGDYTAEISYFTSTKITKLFLYKGEQNLDSNLDDQEQNEEPEETYKITYPIVHTGVTTFYGNSQEIAEPIEGANFYGQDAHYQINMPNYTDNKNGTISDNITGLVWQQEMDAKMTYEQAFEYAENCTLGGYDDWRVPTIKELYSLILFTGEGRGELAGETQYIDTNYFVQPIGNTGIGEREIDAQTWSSTMYNSFTMKSDETVFGVNFVDGRIKGYPTYLLGEKTDNTNYVRLVRGNTDYGINDFVDNGDGTVTDLATGLMWQQDDSQYGMIWRNALSYAENLDYADYDDWRLPTAKELQSIVDYDFNANISPILALDSIFNATQIIDMDGVNQYPYYWSSSSHIDGTNASYGVYVAFGQAQGIMESVLMDVHGAGSQRSDPKSGDQSDYPLSSGPQGDIQYVYNYVRAVRSVEIVE